MSDGRAVDSHAAFRSVCLQTDGVVKRGKKGHLSSSRLFWYEKLRIDAGILTTDNSG